MSQGNLDLATNWLAKPLGPGDEVGNAYILCYQTGVVWEALLRREFDRAADAAASLLANCESTGWAFDEATAKLVALQALPVLLLGPYGGLVADRVDKRRLMVLIAHNNDVGDGWQWADDPRYPADEANRALRIGSNVAVYALTH